MSNNNQHILIFGNGGLSYYIQKECARRNLNFDVIDRKIMNDHLSDALVKCVEIGTQCNGENISVINTVGYGDVSGCERNPMKSYASNANFPVYMLQILDMLSCQKAHIVHMSTNDVFGQDRNIYDTGGFENVELPRPSNLKYCQHKYIAELSLQSLVDNDRLAIVRATMMSPYSKSKGGRTFYYVAYDAMSTHEHKHKDLKQFLDGDFPRVVSGYINQLSCPLSIDTLAHALVECALQKQHGTLHFATEAASRYDILDIMRKKLEAPKDALEECKYFGEGPKRAALAPATYSLEEEVAKFIKLCEGFDFSKVL
jgi:dTDP-4-dehydrorhamnose reductase